MGTTESYRVSFLGAPPPRGVLSSHLLSRARGDFLSPKKGAWKMGSQERRNGKRKRKAEVWSSQLKDINRFLTFSEETPGEVREWA